ncbi:hypothetical protein A5731_04685 [Mycolicibacterium conceptionense]|uniref:Phage capsid-like C-terminal domain-containing protein n=2 Tax=Mycobacteriaceae TaxID=1762 RepID=A0A1A1YL63_9MYCO|nr:hypothetical protein A5718_17085 [Mycolicibacterium conceptionense]OBF08578.1 hypothetical protein A5731_04685 [Mycolicibacterium conceptionense]OBF23896.1 hypothetical protein A5726_10465 [Mycolicibacterium conceptionense]OBF32052.1 hypothetical protein A5720_27610 [Mycolicibacterium conceptionense]OBH92802.1 hypothetical protein A5716_28420 [Mycolicibacterium conceptionense]
MLEAQKKALEPEARELRGLMKAVKDANRDVTPEEKARLDAFLAKVRPINEALDQVAADDEVMSQLKALSSAIGAPGGSVAPAEAAGWKDSGQRLSFKGMGEKAVTALRPPEGSKALVPAGNNTTVVAQGFTPAPIELGKPGTSFLDALPVNVRGTSAWKYLRQTVRTNNAAVVAEGAVKPTSVYSMAEVDGSLVVVAHLSEAIPRYYFVDNGSLEDFVRSEMEYGLQLAVETKVVADINATSGLQTQAFVTDVLTTLRKSITKLENVSYKPAFFVLHPDDWEAIDLLKDGQERYYFGGPGSMGTRTLWDVPVVVSLAQTAGVSHTIASESVAVDTDTSGVQVQWSEESNADDFSRNLIRARCEGRFATSVFRPMGVVKGDLTA